MKRRKKVKALVTGEEILKMRPTETKLIFTTSNESEQSSQRELIFHALTFPVNLPIHRVGKSCPVLTTSLVSNRQEPQLSDTCLAQRHKGAGAAGAQAARLSLFLCG